MKTGELIITLLLFLFFPFFKVPSIQWLRILHYIRKIRPVFYFVTSNITDRFFKPIYFRQVHDRFNYISQIITFG